MTTTRGKSRRSAYRIMPETEGIESNRSSENNVQFGKFDCNLMNLRKNSMVIEEMSEIPRQKGEKEKSHSPN